MNSVVYNMSHLTNLLQKSSPLVDFLWLKRLALRDLKNLLRKSSSLCPDFLWFERVALSRDSQFSIIMTSEKIL